MAKITRIKASDAPSGSSGKAGGPAQKKTVSQPTAAKKSPKTAQKLDKKALRAKKRADKAKLKAEKKAHKKPLPKWLQVITWPFRMLAKPFIALGHYIRDSWQEIRQVRWPSRKATWKSVLAILVYTAIIIAFVALLDAFFTFIFNIILGN